MTKKEAAMNPFSDLSFYEPREKEKNPFDTSADPWVCSSACTHCTDGFVETEIGWIPCGAEAGYPGIEEEYKDAGRNYDLDNGPEEVFETEENPLGIEWEYYYLIMEARNTLVKEGYQVLLGKEDSRWLFRVYGIPYPDTEIFGIPVKNIQTIVPKAV